MGKSGIKRTPNRYGNAAIFTFNYLFIYSIREGGQNSNPSSQNPPSAPEVLLVTFKVIHSLPHPISYLAPLLKPYVPERSIR